MSETITSILHRTSRIFTYWQDSKNWIPEGYSEKVTLPDLEWYKQLTRCLVLWNNKEGEATGGELTLAYSILAELVECWLWLVYCIYFVHVKSALGSNHRLTCSSEVSIEDLKEFVVGKYWEDNDRIDQFVTKVINLKRNVHLMGEITLEKNEDFQEDISVFKEFIEEIDIRLPYPDVLYID